MKLEEQEIEMQKVLQLLIKNDISLYDLNIKKNYF